MFFNSEETRSLIDRFKLSCPL